MRGAALKLGQMISIQDENVLPPAVCPPLCWTPACSHLFHTPVLESLSILQIGSFSPQMGITQIAMYDT